MEKTKEIRQKFAHAVTAGTRSGSGKIVLKYYDDLVAVWGGSAATEPLSFGIDTLMNNNSQEETKKQIILRLIYTR